MLTQDRVERLLADLSPQSRAETAAIVADEFVAGRLTDAERAIAIDILKVLAQDVALQVREALAEHVRASPLLPHDVALTLAHDVETVSVPFIRISSVLTDADLIAIVRSGSTPKQIAVAQRETVSANVADALVATRKRRVIGALLENHGARPGEAALHTVLDRFGKDARIQALLVARPQLPPSVVERVVRATTDEIAAELMLRHPMPRSLFEELLRHGRDTGISRFLGDAPPAEQSRFAVRLHEQRMLSPMLLLRCLCDGRTAFFEAGLAALAGVPDAHAQLLIWDRGPLGLQALFRKAKLPEPLLGAFRAAVTARRRSRMEYPRPSESELLRETVERLHEHYPALVGDTLDSVLEQLWQLLPREPVC